jgi:hypothetical protein
MPHNTGRETAATGTQESTLTTHVSNQCVYSFIRRQRRILWYRFSLISWSRILLEKLIPAHKGQRNLPFMEHKGSLLCSQKHTTRLYLLPNEKSKTSHHISLILSSNLQLGLPSDVFPSNFQTKILNLISSYLIFIRSF